MKLPCIFVTKHNLFHQSKWSRTIDLNTTRPIELDGIEDPKVPRQIAEKLAKRNDVLEVVYFPPAQTKVKGEYRIKLKSSDEFNIFVFYTAT